MARGRMLQNRISKSQKLASLSSDTVRLLYTWLLAHLDVNGSFYADPVMVNNLVFTRLGHSVDKVAAALDELESAGLIIRYQVNKEVYLNYPDFKEKQPKINPDKEGKPDIPLYTPDKLRLNSGEGQEIGRLKIREDKLREANATPEQEHPADNHKSELMASLKTILKKTEARYPDPYDQQKIINFVKSNTRNKNHDAILHCLESLIKAPEKVKAIPQYLEAALKVENGKYNAKDSENRNAEFKRAVLPAPLKAVLGMG